MKTLELKEKYIEFFKSKNHKEIENSSLIPENDPTVLFTTAGMHPLVPYLLGEKHPYGDKLVNIQKCVRTGDIEEVGDETHLTFFEMLGNWSLGDYWKEEAINFSFEFLTKILKINRNKLAITCFKGDKDAPKDTESSKIWESLGIPKERIAFLPKSENWWGPAGTSGPCGPDTEIFYYKNKEVPTKFDVNDENWVELGNDVFMQYNKQNDKFLPLKQKNVDFGGGVERLVMNLNGYKTIFEIDTLKPIIQKVKNLAKVFDERSERIIVDHLRTATFILNENISPSNVEQGYVLRRLIRRAIRHGKLLGIEKSFCKEIVEETIRVNKDYKFNKKLILKELEKEEEKFRKTLSNGLKILEKKAKKEISGKLAFILYTTYGFPIEMTREIAKEKKLELNEKEFEKEFEKHQNLSRTAAAGKFKSGLADNSEQTTKLHTATHLLLQALKDVLSKDIEQRGSNITPERIRFDFNFPRKIERKELDKIEDLVNKKIKENLPVNMQEMKLEDAKKKGVSGVFEHKYGNIVKVYTIGKYSKELCAGPHVKNTKELGKFKIIKEESSSSGVRRIKAILEIS